MILLLLLLLVNNVTSYYHHHHHHHLMYSTSKSKISIRSSSLVLYNKKKGKRSIDDEVLSISSSSSSSSSSTSDISSNDSNNDNDITITSTVRLKEEVSSPFRLLRKFVYSGAGLAGAIGTITAIPQLIIAIQDNNDKITDAITNIGIDIGAIVGSVLLFIQDDKNEKEKLERFAIKEREQYQLSKDDIKEREKEISLLPVEIIFSEENENITRIVSIANLQSNGKQNVILVGGSQSYIKDCLISARIEGNDLFTQKNTYVIPVVIGNDQIQSKTGFGSKDEYMTAPYIGKPTQVNIWQNYLLKEIQLAEKQGGNNVLKQGIVIAIKQNGVIQRRGLGLPPWKTLVEEMTTTTSTTTNKKDS